MLVTKVLPQPFCKLKMLSAVCRLSIIVSISCFLRRPSPSLLVGAYVMYEYK